MAFKIGFVAVLLGFAAWFAWGTYVDWRLGRVPAAVTFTRGHYARRSEAPLLFWSLTLFRLAVVAGLIWRIVSMSFELLTSSSREHLTPSRTDKARTPAHSGPRPDTPAASP
jgi:hypothetical protein